MFPICRFIGRRFARALAIESSDQMPLGLMESGYKGGMVNNTQAKSLVLITGLTQLIACFLAMEAGKDYSTTAMRSKEAH